MWLWRPRIDFYWTARAIRALVIVGALASFLALAAASAQARRAHATNTSGYALTISLANGPSFTFGQSAAPIFQGTLTVPASTTVNSVYFSIFLDGKTSIPAGGLTQVNATTYSYRFATDWTQLSAGPGTAVAYYGNDAQSPQLTFNVNRDPTTLQCEIAGAGYVMRPGVPVTVAVIPNAPGVGIGPGMGGTYTVSFIGGPQTLTYSNLTMDSNDNVTGITSPSQYGRYQMTCAFSGTVTLAPAQAPNEAVTISREQALTGAEFSTDPTTLPANQPWQAYIVLHGQPGGPAPTGSVVVNIDRCYAPVVSVGSNGVTLAHLPPVTNCSVTDGINVVYRGDPYYKDAIFSFPSTNPAIPSSITGGTSGGTSGGQARATATPTPKPTMTPTISGTATAAATATPENANGVNVVATSAPGGGLPLWLMGAVVLVVMLGGSAGTWLLISRRAKSLASLASLPTDAETHRSRMPLSQPPNSDMP